VGLEGKRIDDAQKILDWAITNLNLSIKCMVINYRSENYKVQFFTWENKLIRGVGFNIPEEWIEDTNPTKNDIHDELKGLLIDLEQEAGREMRDLDRNISKGSETNQNPQGRDGRNEANHRQDP
jgi:hypothetical protein